MSLPDQLYHMKTTIQVNLSILCLNLEKKVGGFSSFERQHLETEKDKLPLHTLTVHENDFHKNQT